MFRMDKYSDIIHQIQDKNRVLDACSSKNTFYPCLLKWGTSAMV